MRALHMVVTLCFSDEFFVTDTTFVGSWFGDVIFRFGDVIFAKMLHVTFQCTNIIKCFVAVFTLSIMIVLMFVKLSPAVKLLAALWHFTLIRFVNGM